MFVYIDVRKDLKKYRLHKISKYTYELFLFILPGNITGINKLIR